MVVELLNNQATTIEEVLDYANTCLMDVSDLEDTEMFGETIIALDRKNPIENNIVYKSFIKLFKDFTEEGNLEHDFLKEVITGTEDAFLINVNKIYKEGMKENVTFNQVKEIEFLQLLGNVVEVYFMAEYITDSIKEIQRIYQIENINTLLEEIKINFNSGDNSNPDERIYSFDGVCANPRSAYLQYTWKVTEIIVGCGIDPENEHIIRSILDSADELGVLLTLNSKLSDCLRMLKEKDEHCVKEMTQLGKTFIRVFSALRNEVLSWQMFIKENSDK